jgi:hypothetical protein
VKFTAGGQIFRPERRCVYTALYTIIRIYEVPAENRIQATDRMIEALALRVEGDFHIKDIIRDPDAKPGQGTKVTLKPPDGWLSLIRKQLLGK